MRGKFLISILLLSLMIFLLGGSIFAVEATITKSMLNLAPRLTKYFYRVGENLQITLTGTVTTEKPVRLKFVVTFYESESEKSEEQICEIKQENLTDVEEHKVSIGPYNFNSIKITEISQDRLSFANLQVYEVVNDEVEQKEKAIFIDSIRVNPSISLIKDEKPNPPVIEVYRKSDTNKENDIRDMWINDKDGATVVLNIYPNITYSEITDYRYTLSGATTQEEEQVVPVESHIEKCEFTITNEGITEVKARIKDKTETFSDYIDEEVKIDFTAPTITIEPNGSSGIFVAGSSKPKINVVDQHSGVDASTLKYFWSTTSHEELNEELFTTENAKEFIHEEEISEIPTGISGTYYLYVMAKDKAGNVAFEKSNAYLIDEVAPTVSFDKDGNDDYEKLDELSVTVTVKDENGSGVKTSALKYLWEEGNKSLEKSPEDFSDTFTSDTPITKSIGSDVETTYYLWIYAEDDVGNATITCTEKGFKVDNKAPTILTSSENNGSYEHDKTVTVTFEDDASGLDTETLKYLWDESETTQDENGFEELVATSSTLNLFEANVVTPNKDGIYYLHLVGQDKLGNKVTLDRGPYYIDVTNPVVTFNPDTNANELTTKVPTVNVQDKSTVKVYYKWVTTGSEAPNKTEIVTPLDENGVQPEITNGNYTLYIYAVDEAGNETIANSGDFEINTDIPNVPSILALNNDEQHSEIPNGGSTNGNVNFEFTVSDTDKSNIKEISVDITKDEQPQDTQHIKVNEAGKYVLTLSEAGEYTIKVKAVSNHGESSAEVEFSVTIDNTAPVPPTDVEIKTATSQATVNNHDVVHESVSIKNSESSITIEIYQKNVTMHSTISLLSIDKQGEDRTEDFRTDDGFLITEVGVYDIYITKSESEKTSTIVEHITIEDSEAPKFANKEVSKDVDENQTLTDSVEATDNLKVTSYKVKKNPSHGTLELNEITGEYIYKATSYSAGATDSFEIIAVDKAGNESEAVKVTVKIRKVLTVEDCITEANKNFTINENTSKTVELSDKDKNGVKLTYTVLEEALHGKVEVSENSVVYTPEKDYTGKDSFKVKVSNGVDPDIKIDFAVTIKAVTTGGGTGAGGGSGAGGGGSSKDEKFEITVTVGANGKVSPNGKVEVAENENQKFTITPDKDYVVADVLVDGKSVGAVTEYTFEKVNKNHTLEVTFKLADEPSALYDDVDNDTWYYDAVKFVTEKKLMNGTATNIFAPELSITRGMMATVLYRLAGATTTANSTFADVSKDSYYSNAIAWAAEYGIVNGVGNNLFEPDREISREEIATMMARYIKNMKVNIPSSGVEFAEYEDAKSISDYAVENVKLMRTLGLMQGKNENNFDSKGLATRAEIATILMRFVTKTTK